MNIEKQMYVYYTMDFPKLINSGSRLRDDNDIFFFMLLAAVYGYFIGYNYYHTYVYKHNINHAFGEGRIHVV